MEGFHRRHTWLVEAEYCREEFQNFLKKGLATKRPSPQLRILEGRKSTQGWGGHVCFHRLLPLCPSYIRSFQNGCHLPVAQQGWGGIPAETVGIHSLLCAQLVTRVAMCLGDEEWPALPGKPLCGALTSRVLDTHCVRHGPTLGEGDPRRRVVPSTRCCRELRKAFTESHNQEPPEREKLQTTAGSLGGLG